MFLVMGITGKVGGATAEHLLAQGRYARWSAIAIRRQAGRNRVWSWLTVIGVKWQPLSKRSKA